ncbi:MAG: hypothetical protein ACYDC2_07445 [Solirubrobacteraceae bacterium]
MTDFLDEKRQEITNRLKELQPLVDEYHRLEAAASALAGVGGRSSSGGGAGSAGSSTSSANGRKRGPGRPRGSAARTSTKAAAKPGRTGRRKAGRRKGSGTRAAEALAFVQGQPGITIPELAAKMGIKQNYLYRVLPGLEQEKKVAKQGRGWHPRG